ncbi:MAG: peptidase MA family metallohydrolase [Phycisphaerales bacterium JB041]
MHKPFLTLVILIALSGAGTADLRTAHAAALADDSIENLLQRLETAVLAGDAEAYLANIDTAESEWATEQSNWAADLAEHTPTVFDLDVSVPPEMQERFDPEHPVLRLRVTWAFDDGPERRVEFPARFTLDAHQNWFYAGEAWTSVASDDGQTVVLFLADGLREVAESITEMMPEIREHVDAGFETHLDHPQVVKLYTDMGHLQQSIYLSYTDPLGGWNEPGEAIKLVATRGTSERQLRVLLSHEYGHVATFTYHEEAALHIPWWVAEGVAELAAEKYSGSRARRATDAAVRAWAASGSLAAWDEMADFRETPSSLHGHVYLQGHHFVGYVSERFGRSARNAWVRALASGVPLDEATRTSFGVGFEDLDSQWRDSLTTDD